MLSSVPPNPLVAYERHLNFHLPLPVKLSISDLPPGEEHAGPMRQDVKVFGCDFVSPTSAAVATPNLGIPVGSDVGKS